MSGRPGGWRTFRSPSSTLSTRTYAAADQWNQWVEHRYNREVTLPLSIFCYRTADRCSASNNMLNHFWLAGLFNKRAVCYSKGSDSAY